MFNTLADFLAFYHLVVYHHLVYHFSNHLARHLPALCHHLDQLQQIYLESVSLRTLQTQEIVLLTFQYVVTILKLVKGL